MILKGIETSNLQKRQPEINETKSLEINKKIPPQITITRSQEINNIIQEDDNDELERISFFSAPPQSPYTTAGKLHQELQQNLWLRDITKKTILFKYAQDPDIKKSIENDPFVIEIKKIVNKIQQKYQELKDLCNEQANIELMQELENDNEKVYERLQHYQHWANIIINNYIVFIREQNWTKSEIDQHIKSNIGNILELKISNSEMFLLDNLNVDIQKEYPHIYKINTKCREIMYQYCEDQIINQIHKRINNPNYQNAYAHIHFPFKFSDCPDNGIEKLKQHIQVLGSKKALNIESIMNKYTNIMSPFINNMKEIINTINILYDEYYTLMKMNPFLFKYDCSCLIYHHIYNNLKNSKYRTYILDYIKYLLSHQYCKLNINQSNEIKTLLFFNKDVFYQNKFIRDINRYRFNSDYFNETDKELIKTLSYVYKDIKFVYYSDKLYITTAAAELFGNYKSLKLDKKAKALFVQHVPPYYLYSKNIGMYTWHGYNQFQNFISDYKKRSRKPLYNIEYLDSVFKKFGNIDILYDDIKLCTFNKNNIVIPQENSCFIYRDVLNQIYKHFSYIYKCIYNNTDETQHKKNMFIHIINAKFFPHISICYLVSQKDKHQHSNLDFYLYQPAILKRVQQIL